MKGLTRPIWPICISFSIFLFIITLSPLIFRVNVSPVFVMIISVGLLALFIYYLIRCHVFSELFNIIDDEEER